MDTSVWTWITQRDLPSHSDQSGVIASELQQQMIELGWTHQAAFGARLALEEALVNGMRHGNQGDTNKQVRVECKLAPDRLWVAVADQGPGFLPDDVPDCRAPENLQRPSGRGIFLMRSFMDTVAFNASGNCVVMEKFR